MYHPGKANVVVDPLSRKYVGYLAVLVGRKQHLLHDLENLRAQFIVQDSRVLLARLSVQFNVVERIKLS